MKDNSKDPVSIDLFQAAMCRINMKFFNKQEFKKALGKIDRRFLSKKEFKEKISKIELKFDIIDKKFATKQEFSEAINRLEEKIYTKKEHEKYMVLFDEIVTELRDSRDERKLSEHQLIRLDDRTMDHEKRINVVEKAIN